MHNYLSIKLTPPPFFLMALPFKEGGGGHTIKEKNCLKLFFSTIKVLTAIMLEGFGVKAWQKKNAASTFSQYT